MSTTKEKAVFHCATCCATDSTGCDRADCSAKLPALKLLAPSRAAAAAPAVEAIKFALATDCGEEFLNAWLHGDWDVIRREWPECPEAAFVTTLAITESAPRAFPARDLSIPAEQQGLFNKFDVRRVDGSDQDGGKHDGCHYFVLDMDHDPHANAAMLAYAASCAPFLPKLAADLMDACGCIPCGDISDAALAVLTNLLRPASEQKGGAA